MQKKHKSRTLLALAIAFISITIVAGSAGAYFLSGRYKSSYSIRVIEKASTPAEQTLTMPDLSGFTVETVKMMLPDPIGGQITLQKMGKAALPVLSNETMIRHHARMQKTAQPVYIELDKGVFDLRMIANSSISSKYIEEIPGGWLIKAPLIIGPHATLVVFGPANSIKLAAEYGAFIGNFGTFYALETAVTGWRTKLNEPSLYEPHNEFRPYFVAWSGSLTYMAGSKFSHMGYNDVKSFGVTFSTSPAISKKNPGVRPPEAWLIGNEFQDLYYGLYSYEANDLIIKDNLYKNSIVYGIDPHDRSRRLIISGNKVFGTREKHGIILSRDVNDSWIINNHTYENGGSGIVLDRNSIRNVIANNISERNNGDGVAFFESPENLSWKNKITNNMKSGIRIRNSWKIVLREDFISNNRKYGIEVYTASVDEKRNAIDTYLQHSGFDIADATMDSNEAGHFQVTNVDSSYLGNLHLFHSTGIFEGDLLKHEAALYQAVTTPGYMAEVRKINVQNSNLPILSLARNMTRNEVMNQGLE